MKPLLPTLTTIALGLAVLTAILPTPSNAQNAGGSQIGQFGNGIFDGAPPVIGREAMILQVLPETGACSVHPLAPPAPCPRVRMPDSTVVDAQIAGFHRAGPLTIEVDRLIYDWAQQTASHPYIPAFEYTGETSFEVWSREQWGSCDRDICAPSEPRPVHPAYSIPLPDVVERDFVDLELLSDRGVCTHPALPENQEIACHEVRLPSGEVIALDIGPHARFPVGSMLYFQRVIYAATLPLLDHDRYDFIASQRPSQ